MNKHDKALTALRYTNSRVAEVASYSGLKPAEVTDLAKAHGISLVGRL